MGQGEVPVREDRYFLYPHIDNWREEAKGRKFYAGDGINMKQWVHVQYISALKSQGRAETISHIEKI